MSIFADTFFYLALLDSHDSSPEGAIAATRKLDSVTVTTAWVLLELANALSASQHRRVFVDFLEKTRANSKVVITKPRGSFSMKVSTYTASAKTKTGHSQIAFLSSSWSAKE